MRYLCTVEKDSEIEIVNISNERINRLMIEGWTIRILGESYDHCPIGPLAKVEYMLAIFLFQENHNGHS